MKSELKVKGQPIQEPLQLRQHIVELEAREKQIEESEELFKSFANNSPAGIYIVQDGTIKFANLELGRLSGYGVDELAGLKQLELFPPEERGLLETRTEKIAEQILKGRRPSPYEHRLIRKNGEIRWVVETFDYIKYQGARAFLGYLVDITKRRQAEEALREGEERFRDIAENTADMIWEVDNNFRYSYVSYKMKEMYGYAPEEVIGKSWTISLAPHEVKRINKFAEKLAKSPRPFRRCNTVNVGKDGRLVMVEANGVPILSANGKFLGYRGIDHNVTTQKQLMKNIRFYTGQVTEAQEEERKRIARDLHDGMTQDLASLCIDIDEIFLVNKELPEKASEQLKQLRKKVDSVIDEVRCLSYRLRPRLLDRFGLIPSLFTLVEEVRNEGNIEYCVETVGSERRIASEAELSLYRITQEALRNIVKHSKATKAIIRIEFAKKIVKLAIADNGRGFDIPKDLSSFASRDKFGLMGMAERILLLNGSFNVESKVGKGTTVAVEIPAMVTGC